MSNNKTCWNIFCICWKSDEEKGNCTAEDLYPGLCRLSDLKLKTMLDMVKELYEKENDTLNIKDTISGLKEIKEEIKKKESMFDSDPLTRKLNFYIEKLENR